MTADVFAMLLLDASAPTSYHPTFPGGLIAWLFCYRSRRQEIGGFLMFYYWNLFAGVIVTLVLFAMNFGSYVPENFADKGTYSLFLLSTVPVLLTYGLHFFVGVMLLYVRTWPMMKLLRVVLGVELFFGLLALGIDLKSFPDSTFLDAYSVGTSLIWLLYFMFSKRVVHVFKLHDWAKVVHRIYPEKQTVAAA